MSMSTLQTFKHKLRRIALLLVPTVIISIIIHLFPPPKSPNQSLTYMQQQTDSLTHDSSTISKHKAQYFGSERLVRNLFWSLPLNNIAMDLAIDPQTYGLTVNYHDSVANIGEAKVKRDVIYNTVATMAAIDNIKQISYNFSDASYSFNRSTVEQFIGEPPADLLDSGKWSSAVQGKLTSEDFVEQFFKL